MLYRTGLASFLPAAESLLGKVNATLNLDWDAAPLKLMLTALVRVCVVMVTSWLSSIVVEFQRRDCGEAMASSTCGGLASMLELLFRGLDRAVRAMHDSVTAAMYT